MLGQTGTQLNGDPTGTARTHGAVVIKARQRPAQQDCTCLGPHTQVCVPQGIGWSVLRAKRRGARPGCCSSSMCIHVPAPQGLRLFKAALLVQQGGQGNSSPGDIIIVGLAPQPALMRPKRSAQLTLSCALRAGAARWPAVLMHGTCARAAAQRVAARARPCVPQLPMRSPVRCWPWWAHRQLTRCRGATSCTAALPACAPTRGAAARLGAGVPHAPARRPTTQRPHLYASSPAAWSPAAWCRHAVCRGRRWMAVQQLGGAAAVAVAAGLARVCGRCWWWCVRLLALWSVEGVQG